MGVAVPPEELDGLSLPGPAELFLGVSTAGSAVHRYFPRWAGNFPEPVRLIGVDLPAAAPRRRYRDLLDWIAHFLHGWTNALAPILDVPPGDPILASVLDTRRTGSQPPGTGIGHVFCSVGAGKRRRLRPPPIEQHHPGTSQRSIRRARGGTPARSRPTVV